MTQLSNSQKFKTVTTNLGRNAVAMAHATGTSIKLTHMAVGDGKGQPIEPDSTMTSLVHETYRGQINDIVINKDVEGEFTAELLIPQVVGGFFIREVGLFFEDGTMFAVGNTPLTEKTDLQSGAATDLLVRMIIRVLDAGTIEIFIDPAQVLATREFVERMLDGHDSDPNAHEEIVEKLKADIALSAQLTLIGSRSTAGGWTLLVTPDNPLFLYLHSPSNINARAYFMPKDGAVREERTPVLLGADELTGVKSSGVVTIIPKNDVLILEVFEISTATTIYAYQ